MSPAKQTIANVRSASKHHLSSGSICMFAFLMAVSFVPVSVFGQFDLQLSIANPDDFSAAELAITQEAMQIAEVVWEREILGYQPGITQTTLPISIEGTTTGFANANGLTPFFEGGFWIFQAGEIRINRGILEDFSDFRGQGLNVIDELIAHEIGHVLGIGTTWVANGVYVPGSGQYTGQFGLAAYREEFDPDAEFIPVELSGPPGSRDVHWDQIFRGAGEAGEGDPFDLSPLTGIVDDQDRDLAGELLTAALDPDIGAPFLARFTVESLRDVGFEVRPAAIPEPSAVFVWFAGTTLLASRRRRS